MTEIEYYIYGVVLYLIVGVVLSIGHSKTVTPNESIGYVLFWPIFSVIGFLSTLIIMFMRGKK